MLARANQADRTIWQSDFGFGAGWNQHFQREFTRNLLPFNLNETVWRLERELNPLHLIGGDWRNREALVGG